jgi:hypothetical protein
MAINIRYQRRKTARKGMRLFLLPSRRNLLALVLMLALIAPALAENSTVVRGQITPTATLEYYQETPQNSPYDLYVHQGDTLYLGKIYDLSGASGISYYFAHWNNWKDENANCNPDNVVDIKYVRTLNDPRATELRADKWAVGNWYYWDWWECNITHYNYSNHTIMAATGPLQADNKFAFKVISAPSRQIVFNTLGNTLEPTPGYISAYSNTSKEIIR